MNPAKSNLRVAIAASLLMIVLMAAIAALSVKPSADTLSRRASTFFTDDTGTRAIYMVFEQILRSVGPWRRSFTVLETASATTMIVTGPTTALSKAEAGALDEWIGKGGQLILASSGAWSDFIDAHGFSRPAGAVEDAVGLAQMKSIGKGRLIYVPDSRAFSNATLRTTDHAVWLAERSAEWGDAVLFDEYHHGFGQKRGLLAIMGIFFSSVSGFVCLQLLLAGAIYIIGCKKRLGNPIEEPHLDRTSPLETVQATSGLLESAQARALSVRVIHQYVNGHLSGMFGYRIDLSNEGFRGRLASRSAIAKEELDAYAEAVKVAYGQCHSDAQLIWISQQATTILRSFGHGATRSNRPAATG